MTSFQWSEFLEYARNYEQTGLNELQYRCAVSRAYYCVYHAATEYLKKKNIKISTEGVGNHERLWNTFIQNGKNDMILKAIGNDGTKLRIKRNISDYENSQSICYRDIKEAIRIAGKTIRNLK